MEIISRSKWGARPPRNRTTTTWSQRTEFVVHYSAGPTDQTPRQIQNFHMDGNGWSDVGYNFLVDTTGRIYEGRGWLVVGAHAPNHNTSGLGVCFIGRDGDDTPEARRAIRWLYEEACRRAGRKLRVLGHRDVYSTSCPGERLHAWVRKGMPIPGRDRGLPVPKPSPRLLRLTTPMMHGQDVKDAQRRLNVHGARPALDVDGWFGPATDKATRAFQRKKGLEVDGIIGPRTRAALAQTP